eukprot:5321733-Prymnesium_polylepis.2
MPHRADKTKRGLTTPATPYTRIVVSGAHEARDCGCGYGYGCGCGCRGRSLHGGRYPRLSAASERQRTDLAAVAAGRRSPGRRERDLSTCIYFTKNRHAGG